MKTKTSDQIKGIIFAGCSFTWGQGLYYYSNLPTIQHSQENSWNPHVVTYSQVEYMKTLRYPRLVAQRLGTFEVCQMNNGGSNSSIITFWNNAFDRADEVNQKYFSSMPTSTPQYFYKDFRYIVFQITQWGRSHSFLRGEPYINSSDMNSDSFNFIAALKEKNLTVDEYCDRAILADLNNIKAFLQKFESNGVKALVMSWPNDYTSYVKNDAWYEKRFITHSYHDKIYTCIDDLFADHPNLKIRNDNFFESAPIDDHPSKECHEIMANSVLNKIRDSNE